MPGEDDSVESLLDDLRERTLSFEEEFKEAHSRALRLLREFHARFPFSQDPSSIEDLKESDIYNPGSRDYFFYWVEHKLKPLGHIAVGSSKPFKNAAENLEVFKGLLRKVVDPKLSLSRKVDAEWEKIKGLGGDRHIAKKIIFLYNFDEVMPIFKTKDLEFFVEKFRLDRKGESQRVFGKPYKELSVGQKFEVLNKLLSSFKSRIQEFKSWDNLMFSKFLYTVFKPPSPRLSASYSIQGRPPQPLGRIGLLYEPQSELEVIVLFAMYHRELGFPYILRVGSEFPDAVVLDENGERKSIEFELFSKSFLQHRHPISECDYIVCWEDDWKDPPEEAASKIISLKERLRDILG